MARARCVSLFFARFALACYLMPVILLVFTIGGLAIGVGRIRQAFRTIARSLPGRSSSGRRLVAVPLISRKGDFRGRADTYPESRFLR